MAQSVSDSSSVNTLFITFSSTQNANTTIYIKDNNGNNVITYKPSKTYQNSVICDNNLQIGGSYSVYVDDTKMYDVTISNTISNLGKTGGMGNGMGNGMGGRGGMMQRPPIR